jgi:acetylornithine deacetylase/succinyl-diaminopimelate desuccinylase-like protein
MPVGFVHHGPVTTTGTAPDIVSAQDEVLGLLVELLRIDTSNPSHPERPAAEWVARKLDEVGIASQIIEAGPGRASTIARISGADPSRGALLIHGHLDVVPAEAGEWSVDPFAGEVMDDFVWGRGAVDMKNMNAMTLAVVREWARSGRVPPRDIVLAFVSDEEAGGRQGAHYLVDQHCDLFADCTEAIGEVGGYSVSLNDQARLYLIQTAEKGVHWLRLRAEGRPGHASMIHEDNAVTRLAAAVSRIGAHRFPIQLTDTMRATVEAIGAATGTTFDPEDQEQWMPLLGGMARVVGAVLRNTATPTQFEAGYQANVVPSWAEATIDARFIPGGEQELLESLDELAGPGITRQTLMRDIAVETSFDGALVDAMSAALRAEDPGAHPLPYTISGGTDAKSFSTLGVRCFGFSPLLLPADLDFATLFHGIDERVPVSALHFGVRVLDRLLSSC